jgi:hypothetical protein
MHHLLKISDYSEQGQLVFLTSMFNKGQIIRAVSSGELIFSLPLSYYKARPISYLVQIKLYTQRSEIPAPLVPWISELESLGIKSKKLNELNDVYEVGNLVENIKQSLFQDFKSSYK